MREIKIKLEEKDYLDFVKECNLSGQTAQEKMYEVVNFYLIVHRKRFMIEFPKRDARKRP